MFITFLLLVVKVWDGKPTYRKSWAGKLLVWSDLTLDPSFKVKRGYPNLKVLIAHLLLVLEVWDGKATYIAIHGLGILECGRIGLGHLLQGQARIAKLKSANNSLIIGARGLGWQTNL